MIGGAKGIGIGLDFGIGNIKRPTKRDTLDPAIKDALCGVWIADQNTNESPTRNIIKNKISGKGGDFEILNAAYKGNSGYGKYDYDYTTWEYNKALVNILSNKKVEYFAVAQSIGFYNIKNLAYKGKIRITGLETAISSQKVIRLQLYVNSPTVNEAIYITKDGIYDVDIKGTAQDATLLSMYLVGKTSTITLLDVPVYIEQVPYYQGAFCTDGVDDLIVSQKPVNEMLGGSNELTVVSMIHQITADKTNVSGSLNSNNKWRSNVTLKDKVTGIYGYSLNHIINDDYAILINNILGDKNNYNERTGTYLNSVPEFSVEGYRDSSNIRDVSQVAWYWTLIAKRVLTTDEINQVIAYYNLDKYVAPDIYYDVKKQGLTNENHAEFGDKLIDYSGNGKDMQLYNFGWKLDSGVGKYEEDFTSWSKYANVMVSSNKLSVTPNFNTIWFVYKRAKSSTINSMTVNIIGVPKGGTLRYYYSESIDSNQKGFDITSDGTYTLPQSTLNNTDFAIGFGIPFEGYDWTNIVIEQLPSFENALVFDGVDDYGQYVGDLGLKDYTVVADRAYVKLIDRQVPIISNITSSTTTPFIYEFSSPLPNAKPFSYSPSSTNSNIPININRKVSYQSTYAYNGNAVTKGSITNTGDGLTFGRYGISVQYAALCLYNFMLFPYSLSEFLIERQLKKRKLGTLHPETNNK